jgi:anti-sigma factor RsiW
MTCREFAEFLDAYLAGTLLGEESAAFRRHLAVCPHCITYLDGYQRTVEACQRLRAAENVPGEVPSDLIAAILASRKTDA